MSMFATIRSAWALLLGLAFLMLGNGLQGTLLGVRASLEGFSTQTTGFVMIDYYVGFFIGSILGPNLLTKDHLLCVCPSSSRLISSRLRPQL